MNNNAIDIRKCKWFVRDNMLSNDPNLTTNKATKKAEKTVLKTMDILINTAVNNYLADKNYTDMQYKPIQIKIESSIDHNGYYYQYDFDVTNEMVNIHDKYSIIDELNKHFSLIEYDNNFTISMVNEFKKLAA